MPKRIYRQRCHQQPNIAKSTVIASFEEGSRTRDYLESLPDDDWDILSFNPEERLVCLMLTATTGQIHTLSLVLPVYSNSWRK